MSDFNALWDYDQPAETERRFCELLPSAQQSGDTSYYLQLLTQIARAQGLQRHFDDAHQTLNQVEAQLPDAPVVKIRYLLERGRVFNSSGSREKSRPLFADAYETALQAGEDFYAVDAAHMLGIVEATPEDQLAWNEKAVALAEKSENPRARQWLGSLYNNIGWAYHDQGDYDKALELFQKALTFRESQNAARPIHIARWCIARTLRSMNRLQEALAIQRDLEKNPEDGYVSEEIAECLLAMGDETAALPYFKQAYEKLSQDEWLAGNQADRLARIKLYADKSA